MAEAKSLRCPLARKKKEPLSYFSATKTPFYGIVLTIPILLIYEALTIFLKFDQGDYIRNAADIWIKFVIERFGAHGAFAFGLLMLILVFLAFVSMVRGSLDIDLRFVLLSIGESTLYAFIFSVVATFMTSTLLIHLWISEQTKINFVLALGAGVYEEIIFRALGYGLLPIALSAIFHPSVNRKTRGKHKSAPRQGQIRVELKIIAALFSSLIFAWLHNVESFNILSYAHLYRLIMGILFCILYEFRGLGIVVWTHSLYDVFVILYR